jgi:hypothetical protein
MGQSLRYMLKDEENYDLDFEVNIVEFLLNSFKAVQGIFDELNFE